MRHETAFLLLVGLMAWLSFLEREEELPRPAQGAAQIFEPQVAQAIEPPPFTEEELLARTAYGEARGEPEEGQPPPMHSILNRVKSGQYPGTVEAVVRQPRQFSAWNPEDPNREKMESAEEDPVFEKILELAVRSFRGKTKDPTGGATHYHRSDISPRWAPGMETTREIGAHRFLRPKSQGRR